MNEKLKNWCASATAQIRYKPDRAEVEAELMAHIEDKADALRAQGIAEEELENAVLRSMGSAEAIAPQLAAIHKPFWGYVERASKLLTIAVIAVFLWHGLFRLANFGLPSQKHDLPDNFDAVSKHCAPSTDMSIQVSDSSDGYTYTAIRVAIWPLFDGYNECIVRIRATGGLPKEGAQSALNWFWAVDDLGTYYYSDAETPRGANHCLQIYTAYQDTGLFHHSYDIMFRGFAAKDAKWIELHYDRDGRDIVLHIDLTGGGAS